MKVVADVVVVGAGAIGCSAAFHLAHLGRGRVIVVEKGSVVSGMTKRSGGLIRTHYPNEAEARLALASLRYFQSWKETVGGRCGFTQTGFALVARGAANIERMKTNVAMLRDIGVRTELVSPKELQQIDPAAQVEDISLAAYEPDSGYADPVAATQSLAARAKELGVIFKTGTLVKSIQVAHDGVAGVDTNTGPIEALAVVVAAGGWSDRLLRTVGLEIGIRSERAQVAFFSRPAELRAHLAYMDMTTGAYLRPHSYGLTLAWLGNVAGPDPTSEASEAKEAESAGFTQGPGTNPDRFEESIDPAFIQDIQKRIQVRLPAMAKTRFVRGHTGMYDWSPDGHPVLARAPGLRGLIVAAGFGDAGFALAPAAGACIDELVTEGAATTVNLDTLRFARSRENAPLPSQAEYELEVHP